MNIQIILLHGLGGNLITLYPLKTYLHYKGYERIDIVSYPSNNMNLEEAVEYVDYKIAKIVSRNEPIILIGQSMGGLISNNLHRKGWNIKNAVYIGAPLHGARILKQLDSILPTIIRNFLFKKPYEILMMKEKDIEPPHKYHSISMAWPFTNFDGCVYKDEAMISEKNHTHLAWADHRTIFANPRLWYNVYKILNKTD